MYKRYDCLVKVKPRLNDFSGLGIYEHNELDDVNLVKIEGGGHFELVMPGTGVWPEARNAILALIK